MRRFGIATILGGLLLLGAGGSLSASDTPKAPGHARRKAVASKTASSATGADVKLDNLYVDSEIGQVFTVNLGKADQQAGAAENVASLGRVQVYQLGGSEIEPPATDPADPADPPDSMAPADDDQAPPPEEMAPADGDPTMAPAEGDPGDESSAAPEAAPETDPAPATQPDPGTALQPAPGTAQQPAAPPAPADNNKTKPPPGAIQAPPPPPPPIR